jgi:1-acyl-sn-glycerol-3-phosphate acyltransferase
MSATSASLAQGAPGAAWEPGLPPALRRAVPVARRLLSVWLAAALRAPRLAHEDRLHLAAQHARATLRALDVAVTVRGLRPVGTAGRLVVANHISWLDVYVLNALLPARFVAKSETRDWPVVGTVASRFGALFIVRGSFRDAARVKDAVATALRAGDTVVVFPEATTTDGRGVGLFYPALFQAAIDAGALVQPAAIRYLDEDGARSAAAPFVGDMTFVDSLLRVLRAPVLRAEVIFDTPLVSSNRTRRDLAARASTDVARLLGVPPPTQQRTRGGQRAALAS